jgi:DNA-binding Lrp family transcriptional regulator
MPEIHHLGFPLQAGDHLIDDAAMIPLQGHQHQREPEVMDLWYVTGEQDFVLQVAARDMQSYEQFTRRVLHARDQVRSFKTLVVMGQHKRCGALLPG